MRTATLILAQLIRIYGDSAPPNPSAKLSDPEMALVKSEVLPAAGQYWKGRTENCDPGDSYGLHIVPAFAQGSFTRPQAGQKAVLYQFCMTGHNFANNGIVILEGGSVVAHVVYAGGWDQGILALPDIDGNGKSKILIVTGGTSTGEGWTAISIIGLLDKGVKEFGHTQTDSDYCESQPKGTQTTHPLFVRKGTTPVFYRDTMIGNCGEPTKWQKSGARERITLESAEESAYVRLK